MVLTARPDDLEPSVRRSKDASWELFDNQATAFEQRAGLPEHYCRDIAASIIEIGQVRRGDLIVEIGPGTGQIAQWLQQTSAYIGFDLSNGMLRESQRRLSHNAANRSLIQADANASWPLTSRSARVMFSSRALHLLNQEHVASEVFRIASEDGASLILGRVKRDRDSVRARMAKEMIERLHQHGFEGRRGERENQKLIESCCRRGAEDLGVTDIAQWRVSTSPRQSVESWRCLSGLGGVKVPAQTRDEILNEMEAWAEKEFGGLDREIESEEKYVLRSLRIPAVQERIT
ncbi:MAG TPA: methyltransferase domain-containing protein [Pyrinomonadaceae bacterium]|nr:methyltransferase domain-containing protein [Pyrinomonadaceae bacterium]